MVQDFNLNGIVVRVNLYYNKILCFIINNLYIGAYIAEKKKSMRLKFMDIMDHIINIVNYCKYSFKL